MTGLTQTSALVSILSLLYKSYICSKQPPVIMKLMLCHWTPIKLRYARYALLPADMHKMTNCCKYAVLQSCTSGAL